MYVCINSAPAVHQYWSSIWFVLSFNSPEVVEDGSSILWHTMVRPRGEVVLDYLTRATTFSSMLYNKVYIYVHHKVLWSYWVVNTCILWSCIPTHHQLNISDSVVCKDVLFHHGDIEWTIVLATPTFRPVLLTFLDLALLHIGYHGNSPDFLLPHQSPEVCDSVWKGTWQKDTIKPCIYTYVLSWFKKVPCDAIYLFAWEYP